MYSMNGTWFDYICTNYQLFPPKNSNIQIQLYYYV